MEGSTPNRDAVDLLRNKGAGHIEVLPPKPRVETPGYPRGRTVEKQIGSSVFFLRKLRETDFRRRKKEESRQKKVSTIKSLPLFGGSSRTPFWTTSSERGGKKLRTAQVIVKKEGKSSVCRFNVHTPHILRA